MYQSRLRSVAINSTLIVFFFLICVLLPRFVFRCRTADAANDNFAGLREAVPAFAPTAGGGFVHAAEAHYYTLCRAKIFA